ncbi:MAG: acylneuraminate cytidylyltransferase family protein [Magnetococcales bacterium]|nr:acylneuraminate cytidylyltransferase family protein [Magnetococcales bacterium]
MIQDATVLAVIPARGGSKGVPRKNIRPLAGKPLLAWSIEAALACPEIDRLVLSSEDEEIMAVARQWGCDVPFPRPAELATDDALSLDVAMHLLATLPEPYDFLVWLQPTSPLRAPEDISRCLRLCMESGAQSAVTVTPAEKSPHWMYHVEPSGAMRPLLAGDATRTNRQALPPVYQLNGAVYVARIPWMRQAGRMMNERSLACVMPAERSIDIDSERDFHLAEWWLSRR